MRLWSIHPKYLDSKGLVAVWREGLLAKAVLEGRTKSYANHPQLARFKMTRNPSLYVTAYLYRIYQESQKRGYNFDKKKLGKVYGTNQIQITKGQVDYEFAHLKKKLVKRDRKKYIELRKIKSPEPHPSFSVVSGPVEIWEKI